MSFLHPRAVSGDEAEIARLVLALAAYEKLLDEAVATPDSLAAALFGPNPRVSFATSPNAVGEPVGFALWFYNYSTFVGLHGIFLEDLFVEPAARGEGIGKALLKRLATRCVTRAWGDLEWAVLDWNEPSIAFYKRKGLVCSTIGSSVG